MAVFAVVALAVAVVAMGVAVVAARDLFKATLRLGRSLAMVSERLTPLLEELQSELAVTGVEIETISAGLQQAATDRAQRRRDRTVYDRISPRRRFSRASRSRRLPLPVGALRRR